jgi:tight adherence protein B
MAGLFDSDFGPLILALGLTVVISLFVGLAVVLVIRGRAQSRFKKRLSTVSSIGTNAKGGQRGRKGQQRRLLIQGKLDELEGDKKHGRDRITLHNRIEMSGMEITEKQFYMASVGLGLAVMITVVIMKFGILAALLGGVGLGLGVPRMTLSYKAGKRKKQFIEKFAESVDIIVRGIRSGLPLGECLNIIAREAPDPINIEFRHIIEATRIGLPLPEALERGAERIDVPEFKFFAIVLSIQQETGGNLAETLSNLSKVLRARKAMKDKVKAMSAEARTTAMIIGSLPFAMGILLYITSPKYLMVLFSSSGGHISIVAGIISMLTGSAIMAKMINFKI